LGAVSVKAVKMADIILAEWPAVLAILELGGAEWRQSRKQDVPIDLESWKVVVGTDAREVEEAENLPHLSGRSATTENLHNATVVIGSANSCLSCSMYKVQTQFHLLLKDPHHRQQQPRNDLSVSSSKLQACACIIVIRSLSKTYRSSTKKHLMNKKQNQTSSS
jgi:hypothetical protein